MLEGALVEKRYLQMKQRIEAVKAVLGGNRLDGLLITKPQNWQYLCGFTGTTGVLIMTAADNYLITDFRYLDQAREEACGVHVIQPFALLEDAVAAQVARLGLKRLGVEGDHLTYQAYSLYQEKLPEVELVPLQQAVEKIRKVKDQAETGALRRAAAITDAAFSYILDSIKPGVRESEIALEIEYFMRKNGAQKPAFEVIVASGPRAALPHGVATGKELAGGEFVLLDFGAVSAGYHADLSRTVVLGRPDSRQREIYRLVAEAQERAIKAIKPGVRCSAVDLAARELITLQGYGGNFGHSLGHSVGLEIHEKPSFAPRDETVLEPGMVLTVEPGIYLSGWGGVRLEDLILVTPDGAEILSKSPKNLIEL